MRERSTPETDTETMRDEYDHVDTDFGPFAPSDTVPADFARCLERERDEAREALEFRRGLYKVLEEANNRLIAANQEAVKLARTLKQERDEAREAGWKSAMQAVWERLPMQEYANDPMTPREVAKLIEFVRSQKECAK